MPVDKIKAKLKELEKHFNMCFKGTHVCDNECSGEEAKGYGEIVGQIKAYKQTLEWMAVVKVSKSKDKPKPIFKSKKKKKGYSYE